MRDIKTRVGFITSALDILHLGYMRLIDEALENCDVLLIFLHENPQIERPEKLEIVNSLEVRKEQLYRYCNPRKPIIRTYNTEEELLTLIKNYAPDVRFIGEDYKSKYFFTGSNLGIPTFWIDRSHGISTTKLKESVADTVNKHNKNNL